MSQPESVHVEMAENLAYVRSAIEKRGFSREEFYIALLWATVNLVGLSLYDWSLWAGGIFWMIALPLFGIGSWVWAARSGQAKGEQNKEVGRAHALHWTAIPLFLLIANFVHVRGFDPVLAGQMVLLIVGLVYYLGGVHFWRGYCFGGIALASGVLWLSILDHWAWTVTGVLTFLALAIPALLMREKTRA